MQMMRLGKLWASLVHLWGLIRDVDGATAMGVPSLAQSPESLTSDSLLRATLLSASKTDEISTPPAGLRSGAAVTDGTAPDIGSYPHHSTSHELGMTAFGSSAPGRNAPLVAMGQADAGAHASSPGGLDAGHLPGSQGALDLGNHDFV